MAALRSKTFGAQAFAALTFGTAQVVESPTGSGDGGGGFGLLRRIRARRRRAIAVATILLLDDGY